MSEVGDHEYPEPEWLDGDCPGGLAWACCHADDCGVAEDGTGCELAGGGS